jgi:hypothetical protein
MRMGGLERMNYSRHFLTAPGGNPKTDTFVTKRHGLVFLSPAKKHSHKSPIIPNLQYPSTT